MALLTALRVHELDEAAFVLRAVGIAHDRVPGAHGGWSLVVPASEGLRAAEELRRYAAENAAPTRGPERLPAATASPGLTPWIAATLLAGSWFVQTQGERGERWEAAALLQAGAVRAGELWRLVTALLLHADVRHLVGNLAFGLLFLTLLGRLLGGPLALLLSLGAAIAAHAVEVLLVAPEHSSLGASTAVFAALGVLVGQGARGRALQASGRLRVLGGVALGLAMLAWLGSGDARTDVLAHLLGFAFGGALGALRPARAAPGPAVQRRAAFACVLLVGGSVAAAVLLAAG